MANLGFSLVCLVFFFLNGHIKGFFQVFFFECWQLCALCSHYKNLYRIASLKNPVEGLSKAKTHEVIELHSDAILYFILNLFL